MVRLVCELILVLLMLGSLFLALAWRKPFETNTLVANLEPFPDTFYYSVPAWNWLQGRGYKMAYEGMEIARAVPPLYGIYLVPFFKVWGDVRSYYFANILLCLGSIVLFVSLVDKFFEDSKIKASLVFLTGLILVTNFYFYNLPTLLMAENIQIFLILIAVNLLMRDLNLKRIIFLVLILFLGRSNHTIAKILGLFT